MNRITVSTVKLPLKEKKAARLKLRILDSAMKLIGNKPFRDLSVEDMCEDAEVSRATFFRYFHQKEDIMFYYFNVWSLHQVAEQLQKPLRGWKAVQRLFRRGAECYEKYPSIMLSVISFVANLRHSPDHIEVTSAERMLLYPELPELADAELPTAFKFFIIYVQQAIEDGEVRRNVDVRSVAGSLETIWYGATLSAHIHGESDLNLLYETDAANVFNSIKRI